MIIVSACLAGIQCRYNGLSALNPLVETLVRQEQAVLLCPEVMGGLPTPRPCAELREGRVFAIDGQDVTSTYLAGAEKALQIALIAKCKKAILKSKSPTCGCGLVYDGTFSRQLVTGDGVFCRLLKENHIEVCTENDLGRFNCSL